MKSVALRFVLAVALICVSGCGHATIRWGAAPVSRLAVTSPVLVLVEPGPALPPERADFPNQLLAAVRAQVPGAELVRGRREMGARRAGDDAANFLLIATVRQWRDADTQYTGEADSVKIDVALLDARSNSVIRQFRFESRSSHLRVGNPAPDRLVDEKFYRAVRRLVSPP